MRIERLLEDLEAGATAQEQAASRAELADAVRVESGRVSLDDRLRAGIGHDVVLGIDGGLLAGRLVDVGVGWVAVARGPARRLPEGLEELVRPGVHLVPVAALSSVSGLGRASLAEHGSAIGRAWTSVLRTLARSRVPVAWHSRGGESHVGMIDAVAADHVVLRTGKDAGGIIVSLAQLVRLDVCAPRR